MKRRRWRHGITAMIACAVVLFGASFLALVGIDALEGRSTFQFFADSNTYHEAARGDLLHVDGWADAVTLTGNFLGPMVILALAQQNYYVVLLLNALTLFASVLLIANALRIDSAKLLLVLLVNPLTLSSVLSVNKEILSVVVLALLVHAYARRATWSMMVGLALSLLVRWQLTLFIVVLAALVGPANPLRKRRALTVLGLTAAISALTLTFAEALEPVRLNFEFSAADYEGSGAFQWLVTQQDRGLYWLVFPLKAAHLLFATGLRFDRLLDPTEIYNDLWQLLHSTATLVLFLVLWRMRRLTLRNDLVYLSVLYLAVFAFTPIYTPRYFYLVFVIWSIAVLTPREGPALFHATRAGKRRHMRNALKHTGLDSHVAQAASSSVPKNE